MPKKENTKRYRIEIYDGQFGNDPAAVIESDDPFPPIHTGDYLSHHGWTPMFAIESFEPLCVWQVKAVHHIFSNPHRPNQYYSLRVCVWRIPKPHNVFDVGQNA